MECWLFYRRKWSQVVRCNHRNHHRTSHWKYLDRVERPRRKYLPYWCMWLFLHPAWLKTDIFSFLFGFEQPLVLGVVSSPLVFDAFWIWCGLESRHTLVLYSLISCSSVFLGKLHRYSCRTATSSVLTVYKYSLITF
jgi:hypothetical protein